MVSYPKDWNLWNSNPLLILGTGFRLVLIILKEKSPECPQEKTQSLSGDRDPVNLFS
jgi:hypothetical protein